jgi:hypothetical protein
MGMNENKNETVMLEQQVTRDEGILKPVPIVEKTDYSGAYEVTFPSAVISETCLTCHTEN